MRSCSTTIRVMWLSDTIDNQEILDGSKRLGFGRLRGETETKKVEAEKRYLASEAEKYLR